MDINKILTADFLDIVFDGRNKEYGAYDLRKTYNQRIKVGMIGMLGLTIILSLGAILSNSIKKQQAEVVAVDLSLENVQEEKRPEPPPPPPPKQEPPKVEVTKFAPPYRDWETDRKSTRLNSSHLKLSRMPSSA